MLFLTSILLITFGVYSSATEDDFCKSGLEHCFAPDEAVRHVDFPDSVDTLMDKICPKLKPRFKCMLDFKNKCSEENWPRHFEILDNVNSLLVEACDEDSQFHQELALHLPCIEEVYKSRGHRRFCMLIMGEAMREMPSDRIPVDFESFNRSSGAEHGRNFVCLAEALVMSCFEASVSVRCGGKAGELVGAVVDQIGFLGEVSCPENIREEIKAAVAIVQPLMELRIATEEIL